MLQFAAAYLAALAGLVVIDAIWLGYIARDFYREQLGSLMAEQINWTAGAGFYLLYAVGIVIFAVQPALAAAGVPRAMLLGALFGLFAYATYDLTNLATLRGFPARLAAVDMAWGAFATACAAALGAFAALRV
jgi:uncharacterized membrane protein